MNIQNTILGLALLGLFGLFGHVVVDALSLPTVNVSYSTGECVEVEGEGSCDDMPEKYVKRWVE